MAEPSWKMGSRRMHLWGHRYGKKLQIKLHTLQDLNKAIMAYGGKQGELFLKHIAVWRAASFEAHMEPDFGSHKVCWNFAISINGASSCVDFVSMNPDKEQTFSTSIQLEKSFHAN